MERRRWGFRTMAWLGCLLMALAAGGCAAGSRAPERVLASPEHHVANGLKLLEKGRVHAAHREFRIALDLDPRFALAHRGEAMVSGIRRDFDAAFAACHRAIHHTSKDDLRNPLQGEFSRCGSLRWDRRGWRSPSTTEETTYLARLFVAEFLNAYYQMGVAFKFGRGHERNEEALSAALSITGAFSKEAARHLRSARGLGALMPAAAFGRGVTFVDRVSRADAAALLAEEIGLEDLLGKPAGDPSPPPDLEGHPLSAPVRLVLALGIEGFAPLEDGTFRPESPMQRADFACAAADILERAGLEADVSPRETKLPPFEDVSLSAACLRAMAACADLGILEVEEGRFRPAAPLSGLEAIKGLQRLNELLTPE